jgi:hypothetical protein
MDRKSTKKPAATKKIRVINERKKPQMPRHMREAIKLRKVLGRLRKVHAKLMKWAPDQPGLVATAVTSLTGVCTGLSDGVIMRLEALPMDYAPRATRTTASKIPLVIGMKVRIRARRLPNFEGLIGPDEAAGLSIEAQNGKAYRCRAATSGVAFFLKATDIEPALVAA